MKDYNPNIGRKTLILMGPRFWLYLPLFVTISGILVIVTTRFIAYSYNPEAFSRSLTTISNTAAYDYAAQFFAPSMSVIAFFVMLVWYMGYIATKERITTIKSAQIKTRFYFVNKLVLFFGLSSCVFLILLACVSLKDNNAFHIYFSYGFFITQLISFSLDTTLLLNIRKYLIQKDFKHNLTMDMRPWICVAYIINALIFYFLYLYKGSPLLSSFSFTKFIYIISEYTFVFIGLCYSTAYRSEIKYYINNFFETMVNKK